MYHKSAKYTPLEPLNESPNSSWGGAAQAKLLESEREGKGYQQIPKVSNAESEQIPKVSNAEGEPMNPNEPAETKINAANLDDTIRFKNIGFVNHSGPRSWWRMTKSASQFQ